MHHDKLSNLRFIKIKFPMPWIISYRHYPRAYHTDPRKARPASDFFTPTPQPHLPYRPLNSTRRIKRISTALATPSIPIAETIIFTATSPACPLGCQLPLLVRKDFCIIIISRMPVVGVLVVVTAAVAGDVVGIVRTGLAAFAHTAFVYCDVGRVLQVWWHTRRRHGF